jgi:hypothetical protein
MLLLPADVALIATGECSVYLLSLVVARNAPSAGPVMFPMAYLAVLWVSWTIAVRITAPKTERRLAAAFAKGDVGVL